MRLADTLAKLTAPHETRSTSAAQAHRVMKYAPRYQLAFTLLNEDASSGMASLSWDVQGCISGEFDISPDIQFLIPPQHTSSPYSSVYL